MTTPLIRFWDGDWNLIATVEAPIEPHEQGEGWIQLILPTDHEAARWLVNSGGVPINVSIDDDDKRWHGVMDRWEVSREPCPTCKQDLRYFTIVCEPATLMPTRVLNYGSPFSSASNP